MELKKFSTRENFWKYVTDIALEGQKLHGEHFKIALSGGSSAKIITALNDTEYNWQQGTVWQVDERYVSAEDEKSNQKYLKDLLGKKKEVLNVFDVEKERHDAIEDYDAKLEEDTEGYVFDMVVLGVGSDGHIASIFPVETGEMGEKSSRGWVQESSTTTHDVRERMGLSMEAIVKSREVLVLLQGASKQKMWDDIEFGNLGDVPLAKLLAEKENVRVVYLP